MTRWFLLLVFLIPICSRAQSPVTWEGQLTPVAGGAYLLQLQGSLQPGWRIYTQSDTELGIDGLWVQYEDNLKASGGKWLTAGTPFKDPLFEGKAVTVFTATVGWEESLHFTGTPPAQFTLIVQGFAARESEFLPLQDTVTIAVPGETLLPFLRSCCPTWT